MGRSDPSVNLGPPHISKTVRDGKLKFYTHLDGPSALFGNENLSVRGSQGRSVPIVNLGPLISRKLLQVS